MDKELTKDEATAAYIKELEHRCHILHQMVAVVGGDSPNASRRINIIAKSTNAIEQKHRLRKIQKIFRNLTK